VSNQWQPTAPAIGADPMGSRQVEGEGEGGWAPRDGGSTRPTLPAHAKRYVERRLASDRTHHVRCRTDSSGRPFEERNTSTFGPEEPPCASSRGCAAAV
jgi:hypothetical protein